MPSSRPAPPAVHLRSVPAAVPSYLAARGLALVDDVGADEYRARYLRPAAMKLRELYRAAIARVI